MKKRKNVGKLFDIRFFLENLVETCLQTFFYEVLKNGLTEKKIEEH